jgi:hypothetical protein
MAILPYNIRPTQKLVKEDAITGDTTLTNVVPAGYLLQYIIFEETAGNAATIDLGTTDGGNDVFTGQIIAASDITTVVLNKVFSLSTTTSLYINDDQVGSDWNSASVNVTIVLKKVI